MVDFVIHVHRVHLDILEVKTSLGVLNYPAAATMKRYQGQIRHVGRDKRTNISSYNSMNTKQDGGPKDHELEPSPYTKHTRAQSLYKAYYDSLGLRRDNFLVTIN